LLISKKYLEPSLFPRFIGAKTVLWAMAPLFAILSHVHNGLLGHVYLLSIGYLTTIIYGATKVILMRKQKNTLQH
jgi:hypothetical protein